MASNLKERFDAYINNEKIVSIVKRENLMPAEGMNTAIAAATYAEEAGTDPNRFMGGVTTYKLPPDASGRERIGATIDSKASYGNRLDSYFLRNSAINSSELVPDLRLKTELEEIHFMEAPHRLADASLRAVAKGPISEAFKACVAGDSAPIARLEPMSVLRGVWDSRDSRFTRARMLSGSITAEEVTLIPKNSSFSGSAGARGNGFNLDGCENPKEASGAGHERAPNSGGVTHTIMANRYTLVESLDMIAVRNICAGRPEDGNEAESMKLRRYIFGLGLVMMKLDMPLSLRSECNFMRRHEGSVPPIRFYLAHRDGTEEDLNVTLEEAFEYCKAAKDDFGGFAPAQTFTFLQKDLVKSIDDSVKEKAAKKSGKKAGRGEISGKTTAAEESGVEV